MKSLTCEKCLLIIFQEGDRALSVHFRDEADRHPVLQADDRKGWPEGDRHPRGKHPHLPGERKSKSQAVGQLR